MKAWIVTQAWEGEILGVFGEEALAAKLLERIESVPGHKPTCIEEHEVVLRQVEQAGQV